MEIDVVERTLAILKPDCVHKKLIGEVIARIQKAGFKIIGMKMTRLTKETASRLYAIHRGKAFFEGLVEFVSSGPCVVITLENENAVEEFRKLIGATDPKDAAPGTIRKDFADSKSENIVHGSDSPENAKSEIKFLFSAKELVGID